MSAKISLFPEVPHHIGQKDAHSSLVQTYYKKETASTPNQKNKNPAETVPSSGEKNPSPKKWPVRYKKAGQNIPPSLFSQ